MSEPFKGLAPANIRVVELDYIPPYVLVCPYFTLQPASVSVDAGENAVFSATSDISTEDTITYQWQVSTDGGISWDDIIDGAQYSGATTDELTAIAITADQQGYLYRVEAAAGGCTVDSGEAMLTVIIVTGVERAMVGGGGGGGKLYGGGGGGGQFLGDSIELNPTLPYSVVIGDGGLGSTSALNYRGQIGGDTTFNGDTVKGGGGGGGGGFPSSNGVGGSGGPGGGGGQSSGAGVFTLGGTGAPGGTGGSGFWTGGDQVAGGGGASSGANGQSAYNSGQNGGNGADGALSSVPAVPTRFGPGGGGGVQPIQTPGAGGAAGGGAGGKITNGFNGSGPGAGGGGGSGNAGSNNGGNGFRGELVLRYYGAPRWTGGTVTSDGGDTIHTFTASGSLDPL